MKIHVRRRHIERGKRGKVLRCPIALACREAIGGRPKVGVTGLYIRGKTIILPRAAQKFIDRFDAGKPVKPFAFVLK